MRLSNLTSIVYIGSELLPVAIATPVGVVLCLMVVPVVIIAVLLVWKRHRQRRQYGFQQLKFSEVNQD